MVTEPITSDIPKDLRITFLTCSSPGCAAIADAFKDAADLLEWDVNVLTVEPQSESIQAAYNTAIRDEPDGVAVAAVSSDAVGRQLDTLEEMGIPVVTVQDPDEKFGPIIATLYTSPSSIKLGELTADYLISKECGQGHTIYVHLGGYLVLDFRLEGFERQLGDVMPDFSYEVFNMPATEANPSVPIVGAARAHGDVECVYLSSDHMTTGLPQAFESAGMEIPKIITDFGGATTLQYIRDGLVEGTNVGDSGSYGWIYMDAFARHFAGQSTQPTEDAFQSVWFVDESNVPDDVPYSHVEDLPAKYAAVWNVE
jgi:ABC-type sugar transport system substrate-binding protein